MPLWSDIRQGIRQLASARAFSIPAVSGLALAIAATTAVFGVLNATMLHSLGFTGNDRIIAIWSTETKRNQQQVEACYEDLVHWRSKNGLFESVAIASSVNLDTRLIGEGPPQEVDGTTVSGSFFRVLGARAARGRLIEEKDDVPNAPVRVVISHRLWQTRFGGAPSIVGRQIQAADGTATVIGIASRDFDFPRDVDIWLPLRASWPSVEKQARFRVFRAVARLQPGVTPERAEAELNVLSSQIASTLPAGSEPLGVTVRPMLDEIYGPARRAIWVLMGAVCFVLLIACANVANLLLARSNDRGQELAIRIALGASRARVTKLLVAESLVLGVAACSLGLALAWVFVRALASLAPPEVPRIETAAMDLPVLVFGILVTLATVLLFGLGPALIASKRDPGLGLRHSGFRASATRAQKRLRSGLVIAEVALSLVLLVGAGLLVRSFHALSSVDPGFNPERVLNFRITTGLQTQEQRRALYTSILERVKALPGVESAGAVLLRPLSGLIGWDGVYTVEGQSPEEQKNNPSINYQAISPGYFQTMGIPILSGRDFTGADTDKAPGVVAINESTARRHWPGGNAVGSHVRLDSSAKAPVLTVVAVVRDVRYREWEAVRPDFYVPYTQHAQHRSDFVVKTSGDPLNMSNAVRQAVFDIDKNQPVSQLTTMERLVNRALSRARFSTTVLATLAGSALLLAMLGVYGVVAYTVTQRRFEIGIRAAIGATPSQILRHLIAAGLSMAGVGAAAGLALAVATNRVMAILLYRISAFDIPAYAGAAVVTLVLATAACVLPAWRAAQADPGPVLKSE